MPHFRFFRLPEASPWRLMDPASPATTSTKPQRLLLMDSQQTDQDRRQVRTRERQFLNDIKENASELILLESDKFFRATQELDVMYEHVCYPREANLDGLCLGELDTSLGKQSKMLSGTDMTKFNCLALITASCEACAEASGGFNWNALGEAAGCCFQSVPDTNFLFGVMDTEEVTKKTTTKKKPSRRIEDSNVQEAQPQAYTAKAKDMKAAQARRLDTLETVVGDAEQKVSLFDVTLDSRSFEQTVENLFDTSFLVHRGSLEIGIDAATSLPYLERTSDAGDSPRCEQSIISITPAQWGELVKAYGRNEPLVGHRS